MGAVETVLYHYWRSSASWRVRWALAVKEIPFEKVAVQIVKGEQLTPEHRARNPMGHVPALFIDGNTLAESVAILEYLEETRPERYSLLPKGALARARVRQFCEHINAGVQPLQNLITLRKISDDAEAQKAWAAFFNERGMVALESLLERMAQEFGEHSSGFVIEGRLTMAELFLVPQVYSARRFGVSLDRFPRVLAAEKAALATEHADGARPETQPDAPKT